MLREIADFVKNPTNDMPIILTQQVIAGARFPGWSVNLGIFELGHLRLLAPKLACTFPLSDGYPMPIAKDNQSSDYHAYHPLTGKYLGTFSIPPTYASHP